MRYAQASKGMAERTTAIKVKGRILFVMAVCLAAPLLSGVRSGGDIVYTKPLKAVVFSHKAHTEDIGLHCKWCHAETFEMEALNMQNQADINMESLCNEKYCGTCHNGDVAFSTTTQCARCHIGKMAYEELVRQGKVKADKSVPIPREEVIGRKPKVTGDEDLTQSVEAATRNSGSGQSAALKQMIESGYYPRAISLQPGEGASPVIFNHRTHTERQQQSCIECHPKVFKMKTIENFGEKGAAPHAQMVKLGKYCAVCHNGEKAFSVADPAHCGTCHHAPPAP